MTRSPAWGHPFPALLAAAVVVAVGIWGVIEVVRARRLAEIGFEGARWIWLERSPARHPVHFSAIREFELPAAPPSAEARVFVDRGFQLWINGTRAGAGGQGLGDAVARFEVAPLLRAGSNTVAIIAESPIGRGGILFALQAGAGPPAVVSGPGWSVDPTATELLRPTRAAAAVLGRPPMRPWGYPRPK